MFSDDDSTDREAFSDDDSIDRKALGSGEGDRNETRFPGIDDTGKLERIRFSPLALIPY